MSDALAVLEWPLLFERLLQECWTPYGVRQWQMETFLDEASAIEVHLAQVEALKTLLLRYGEPRVGDRWPDVEPLVRRVAKQGDVTLEDLQRLMNVLGNGRTLFRHFQKGTEKELDGLSEMLNPNLFPDAVWEELSRILDRDGNLRDDASPKLGQLRHRLRQQKQSVQQKIQHYFQNGDLSGAFQSQTPSEREGRLVLAVKVEQKSKVPGINHGASASGATVFVEPQGLVELNNGLRDTEEALSAEIRRILREVAAFLHLHAAELETFLTVLGKLDKRLAAARLSRLLRGEPVHLLQEEQAVQLRQARHPLLILNRPDQKDAVVPNDILLGQEGIRTLVITGPNTGGKTVLLKTLGLFALMLRAGLHLPVAEGSKLSLFTPVMADIGDQQNLTQNLSTFSAHLQRLKSFLDDDTNLSRGLVLIDEICAGTDPAEGSALAKAVLDELYKKGGLTMVTTHLGELKVDAHQHAGFMNASVEFDPETLRPTYRLILGVPGSSNALTIARQLGLKEAVIEKARSAMSAPVRESGALIEELETKNRQLEEELQKARSFRISAQESYEKVEWERQKLEDEKRQSLRQFQSGLKGRVHELEEQLKRIRKDIQQDNVRNIDKVSGKLTRIGKHADDIFTETRDTIQTTPPLQASDLKVGETVYSKQLDLTGEILSIQSDAKEVILQSGILKVTVPISDLQKPYQRKAKPKPKPATAKNPGKVVTEEKDIGLTCDVRGQRAEEALGNVEKFLDDALLAGYEAVAIVHGLGTGALKQAIRDFLRHAPYVKRYYPAQATQGGDGKTIVEL